MKRGRWLLVLLLGRLVPLAWLHAEAPAAGRSILRTTRTHKGAEAYREVAQRLSGRGSQGAEKAASAS